MLHKAAQDIGKPERQLGKSAELARGFGGSIGAWRRIVPGGDEGRTDEEVKAVITQWRGAHPMTRAFWQDVAKAARAAILNGSSGIVDADGRWIIRTAFDVTR
jgi:DNA polymerase